MPPAAGSAAAGVCELLLKLYPLRQPLLSRHATDVLSALPSSTASHLSPKALAELISAVLAQQEEALGSERGRDLDLTLALTRFLEAALSRCAGLRCAVLGGWAA